MWVVKVFKIFIFYENLVKIYFDYDKIDSKFLSLVNIFLKNGVFVGRFDGYFYLDDYIIYEELVFIFGSFKLNILSVNGLKEVKFEIKDI